MGKKKGTNKKGVNAGAAPEVAAGGAAGAWSPRRGGERALAVSRNPYVDLINKRVRNYRKKLDKIEKIQTAIDAGQPVNQEQEGTVQRRGEVAERLAEYEKLRRDMLHVKSQAISSRSFRRLGSDGIGT